MTTATSSDHLTSTTEAWLTRLRLNTASRAVQQDLRNATALHRRVMSLVPDGLGDAPRSRAGVLFRLETDGTGVPVLLVQSRIAPDTTRLPHHYAETQTKGLHALLTALSPGLPVRYRLLGNAVRRCGRNSTEGRWKQAIPLHGEEADRWWTERATAAGLALNTVLSEPAEPLTAWHHPADRNGAQPREVKGGGKRATDRVVVPHQATRFEGTATVRDPRALRHALLHGIGRSKSYGCGLLSLAPGRQDG
ncbi:type I-E CRISPR-associated protein Cas6/Cse3/CasE [Streptomyces calidiresistens]|uniref:Type I-E CRISPR-associated protein Cas6/Cse3/CasE n=1 Tax=Streptomyces calidiresistens TaxID=1485586 RepID=A0A7W3T136_9ACTN|nr:type I-E CRISPR-associated protein Cas6/Cse3/CasE [Streptomyces calidiresistens]MBB0229034.1 type I-E CRISPR-associated protein Cas6/Cse3/CasE [Streptomyces calidiresistens]